MQMISKQQWTASRIGCHKKPIPIIEGDLIGKTLRKDKAAYSDFMEYCKTSKKNFRETHMCA